MTRLGRPPDRVREPEAALLRLRHMRLTRPAVVLGLLMTVLAVPVISPPRADALSCVAPDWVLGKAGSIFTGTIVDGAPGRVLVDVGEVWRGDPVESPLWLSVSLEDWSPWRGPDGTIPDGFSSPRTWLFAPERGSISPCSVWPMSTAFRATVAEYRPRKPTQPIAASPPETTASSAPISPSAERGWWSLAGVAGGLAATAGLLARALRRRATHG